MSSESVKSIQNSYSFLDKNNPEKYFEDKDIQKKSDEFIKEPLKDLKGQIKQLHNTLDFYKKQKKLNDEDISKLNKSFSYLDKFLNLPNSQIIRCLDSLDIIYKIQKSYKENCPNSKNVNEILHKNINNLLDFSFFRDLCVIIETNWDDGDIGNGFKKEYGESEYFKKEYIQINEIRNEIAHSRGDISEEDISNLREIYKKFEKIMNPVLDDKSIQKNP